LRPTNANPNPSTAPAAVRTAGSGAERQAYRDFTGARRTTREHEVGHVAAGDQYHERDGAEQHQERGAHGSEDHARDRLDVDAARVVDGVGRFKVSRHGRHLGLRLRGSGVRCQARNDEDGVRIARQVGGIGLQGQPEVDARRTATIGEAAVVRRRAKDLQDAEIGCCGQDTDDRDGPIVEENGAA
jgi:hypothetical protein